VKYAPVGIFADFIVVTPGDPKLINEYSGILLSLPSKLVLSYNKTTGSDMFYLLVTKENSNDTF